ncbi:MAG: BON domain-containing protein [Thermoguttaceae bacterium]
MLGRAYGWVAVIAAVLAFGPEAIAQRTYSGKIVRGMFGPRVLGEPLRPGVSRFAGGIVRGPAGEFVGRGRLDGRLMFDRGPAGLRPVEAQGWELPGQPPVFVPYEVAPRPVAGGAAPLAGAPAPSEEWFRAPAASGGPALPPSPGGFSGMPAIPPNVPAQSAPVGSPSARAEATPPAASPASPATGSSVPAPPRLSLGPAAPLPPARDAGPMLSAILQRSGQIVKRSPLSVTVRNDTAILRGRVATEHDRLLAETMALLEPGIWRVENELVVEAPKPSSAGSSR